MQFICRKCAMRTEDINGRRVVIRRLVGMLHKHPDSAKNVARLAEINASKAKIKEDQILIDTCECTVEVKV